MHLNINFESYLELEKISNGSFFPLKGFMDEKDFNMVANTLRLSNGKLFPIPVLLPLSCNKNQIVKKNEILNLIYKDKLVGSIKVRSIFKINFNKYIQKLFNTKDINHPGFKMLKEKGELFIAGSVKSFSAYNTKYSKLASSPKSTKKKIQSLGLKKIAGFQTRNVPHKAHEFILDLALKQIGALFIQPLIGKKKSGDFHPDAVINSYKYLVKNHFPKNKVILGALTTNMRYAGPREALFHAIIRKNYGCTHFLVGRDHAGVGSYYGEYDAQKLCMDYESELGIKIVKVRGPFFCNTCKKITNDEICKDKNNRIEVSGTKIRNNLINNQEVKQEYMRKEIIKLIRKGDIFIK